MKKTAICALAVCAMLLASCGGKGEEAVKEYRSICNEYVEAVKSGDMDKVASVNEQIRDFQEKYKDLDSEDFTDDQKQETGLQIPASLVCVMQPTLIPAHSFGIYFIIHD